MSTCRRHNLQNNKVGPEFWAQPGYQRLSTQYFAELTNQALARCAC
jgi:hypothetical protein